MPEGWARRACEHDLLLRSRARGPAQSVANQRGPRGSVPSSTHAAELAGPRSYFMCASSSSVPPLNLNLASEKLGALKVLRALREAQYSSVG